MGALDIMDDTIERLYEIFQSKCISERKGLV